MDSFRLVTYESIKLSTIIEGADIDTFVTIEYNRAKHRGCLGYIGTFWGTLRGGDHWGDLGVDEWIILGWLSRRWEWVYGLDWACPG